jgi:alpha-L-fucosidase 2
MDMQILRALFSHCIDASQLLKTDKAFREQLVTIKSRLIPNRINPKTARLLEWRDDREPSSYNTGQLGHLWGLCPGDEITPWGTPDLAKGAENSLLFRKISLGSWCSGTRLNYSARLHNAPLYEQLLNNHMRGQTLPNMMSHFNRNRFQIDGNLGMTASVAEAILQSHGGEIHLLPALPESWQNGSIKGLRARGGFEVDLEWANGSLRILELHSLAGQKCTLVHGDKRFSMETVSGTIYLFNSDLKLD